MIALFTLGGILVVFFLWAIYDILASARQVPGQHSASTYIKAWVRERPWHKVLLGLSLTAAFVFLVLHLVEQVI